MKLPRYVLKDADRHGNMRFYYRRYGRKIRLRGEPGSPEFASSLQDAGGVSDERPKEIKSFVYFITYGSRVKIGTCVNVQSRFNALRTGIPGKCRVRYVTPGDHKLERYLHVLFAEDRISGEWFQYSRVIQDWIEADAERRRNCRGVFPVPPDQMSLSHPK